jgi:cytochrome c556
MVTSRGLLDSLTEGGLFVRKLPVVVGALAVLAAPVFAAEDPIAARKALMDSNGAAAGLAGAIMKDEVAYSPVMGRAVFWAFNATGHTYGDYFPEGSLDPERSNASPKIWEDMAGFQAEIADFQANVTAALEAAGREGPADKAAFAASVQPIFENCTSCHEAYRTEN